jgi:hypothetical protein
MVVFGPLPRGYRVVLVLATLALCLVGGLLLTVRLDLPPRGLALDLAFGVVLAFVLVHDFQRPVPRAQRVRVRR